MQMQDKSSTNFGKSKKGCFGHSIHSHCDRWVETSNGGNEKNRRTLLQVRDRILYKSQNYITKSTVMEKRDYSKADNNTASFLFHLEKNYRGFDIYFPLLVKHRVLGLQQVINRGICSSIGHKHIYFPILLKGLTKPENKGANKTIWDLYSIEQDSFRMNKFHSFISWLLNKSSPGQFVLSNSSSAGDLRRGKQQQTPQFLELWVSQRLHRHFSAVIFNTWEKSVQYLMNITVEESNDTFVMVRRSIDFSHTDHCKNYPSILQGKMNQQPRKNLYTNQKMLNQDINTPLNWKPAKNHKTRW